MDSRLSSSVKLQSDSLVGRHEIISNGVVVYFAILDGFFVKRDKKMEM